MTEAQLSSRISCANACLHFHHVHAVELICLRTRKQCIISSKLLGTKSMDDSVVRHGECVRCAPGGSTHHCWLLHENKIKSKADSGSPILKQLTPSVDQKIIASQGTIKTGHHNSHKPIETYATMQTLCRKQC